MKCELRALTETYSEWWRPSSEQPMPRWWLFINGQRLRLATDIEIELWTRWSKVDQQESIDGHLFEAFGGTAAVRS